MAGIGDFIACETDICFYLRYNMRSQTYAKSLPMVMTKGALKRLDMLRSQPEHREKLWTVVNTLQKGLKEAGFDLGKTNTQVTPVYMKGGEEEATQMIYDLRENYGIFCSIVVYPVIPKGMILLRLIPTASHTMEDIKITIDAFKDIRDKLKSGYYATVSMESIAIKQSRTTNTKMIDVNLIVAGDGFSIPQGRRSGSHFSYLTPLGSHVY